MSLIVARQDGNAILVVSDTKLTYPLSDRKSLKNKVEDSVLKSVIINSKICISYAGEVDFAEDAIKSINSEYSIEEILKNLLNYHQLSDYKTLLPGKSCCSQIILSPLFSTNIIQYTPQIESPKPNHCPHELRQC